MSDETRRASDWDRKEELVLETLKDLRLSSDAALRLGGELKESFATLRAEMKGSVESHRSETKIITDSLQTQINKLESRFDAGMKWLLGVLGTIIGGGLLYFFTHLGVK